MKVLLARHLPLAFLAAGALAAGAAGAAPKPSKNIAAARAYSIKIQIPGQPQAGTAAVAAPPDAVALGGSYSYPADGSVVATQAVSASASTDVGLKRADASGTSEVDSLQLFGGEITASRIVVRAAGMAGPDAASAGTKGSTITELAILGQPVTLAPNLRVPLADWGTVTVLEQTGDRKAPKGRTGAATTMAALDVQLTQPHSILPAGTRILVAYAEASVQAKAAPPPPPPPLPPPPPTTTGSSGTGKAHPSKATSTRAKHPPKPPEPKPSPFGARPIQPAPRHVHVKLTAGGYVFPIFGTASFTDTFGEPRADTGWHHGDDIFAPLGAPVLAVAKGVLFSVGWQPIGGNRLWLADRQGNQFYYAHLSAYSPLAVNGGRVKAGDVIGFVGNTGDAIGTPYHLHFEIHPVSLLGKGYDGVVDPTPFLMAWQRLRDLTFSSGVTSAAAAVVRRPRESSAPQPGAILLQVSDISTVAGLDPTEIRRALAAGKDLAAGEGQAALLGLAKRG